MLRVVAVSSLSLVSVLVLSSCNRRVFQEVTPSCQTTISETVEVPTQKEADILIVVDNSGSMLEEQTELVENFLNQNAAECPLQDLQSIPPQFKNPVADLYTGDGPLADCGFIQLLAAFENDFRVGVITTDVGLCDNRIPEAQGGPDWGFRPQRGCLQPDSAPGGSGRKVIAATDLEDNDGNNDDFAQRFADTLNNIRTFGSPFERHLDAVVTFLDESADRHPDCAGDLASFRRPDASLVVIFLTDEEDCSHGLAGALEAFGNENEGEVCGEFFDHFSDPDASRCYQSPESLTPVDVYVSELIKTDPKVKVAVIAGGIGDPNQITPSGCRPNEQGVPEGGDGVCFPSGGLSNFTGPGQLCSQEVADAERNGTPCCQADPGDRLYQFADLIAGAGGDKQTDSICNASFRSTMLDIAAFIAAVDVIRLAEAPANPDVVVVELKRANATEEETVQRLPSDANCAVETGWKFNPEDATEVQLCGDARPGPGDNISVRALGGISAACQELQQ